MVPATRVQSRSTMLLGLVEESLDLARTDHVPQMGMWC